MNQTVYKFSDSNRRIEKLIARIRRIVLTTISEQGFQSSLKGCFITDISLSPDLSSTRIGIYGEKNLSEVVSHFNLQQKLFNKALSNLGTKRSPRCSFYADEEYPKLQALQEALNKARDDSHS